MAQDVRTHRTQGRRRGGRLRATATDRARSRALVVGRERAARQAQHGGRQAMAGRNRRVVLFRYQGLSPMGSRRAAAGLPGKTPHHDEEHRTKRTASTVAEIMLLITPVPMALGGRAGRQHQGNTPRTEGQRGQG